MKKPNTVTVPIDRVEGEAFHHGLQCSVRSVTYDFVERRGRVDMERLCCCDMEGCIAFFEAIDRQVQLIETFSGEKPDTAYVRRPELGWEAILNGKYGRSFIKPGEARPNLWRMVWRKAGYAV
jgi:hypothetical protein